MYLFAINLAVIGSTLKYLGAERFGLWATLSSFTLMIGFADLGIGNGLLNALAEANGRCDRAAVRRLLSSGFALLSVLAVTILLLFLCVHRFLDWSHLLGTTGTVARLETAPAIAVVTVVFALSLPLSIVQKYYIAKQEGYTNSLWQVFGVTITAAALFLAIRLRLGVTPLIGIFSAGPALGMVAAWAARLHGRSASDFSLSLGAVSFSESARLVRAGLQFFTIQTTTAFMMQCPSLIICMALGASAVAPYAIVSKFAMIAPIAVSLAVQPLWPAYADARARGQYPWIRRAFYRSLIAASGFCLVFCLVSGATLERALRWWLGGAVRPSRSLIFAVLAFASAACLHYVTSMCLNGCGRLRSQIVAQIPAAIVALLGTLLYVTRYGVVGVVGSFAAGESLIAVIQVVEICGYLRDRQQHNITKLAQATVRQTEPA
jgi:O-antigen/teichoic acid export membrane protein